jgi:hypothetical protein
MTLEELLEDKKYLQGVVNTTKDLGHAEANLAWVEKRISEHPTTRAAAEMLAFIIDIINQDGVDRHGLKDLAALVKKATG